MKTFYLPLPILLLLAFCLTSPAQTTERLDLILVEANNQASTTSPALKKYLPLLKKLGFKSYQISSQTTITLRDTTVKLGKGFSATFSNTSANKSRLTVSRNQKQLSGTTISFKPNRPVVLGGYPCDKNTMILILVSE